MDSSFSKLKVPLTVIFDQGNRKFNFYLRGHSKEHLQVFSNMRSSLADSECGDGGSLIFQLQVSDCNIFRLHLSFYIYRFIKLESKQE